MDELYTESAVFVGESEDFDSIRQIVTILAGDNAVCEDFLNTIFCFYEFQPCELTEDNVSQLIPICTHRCPEFQRAYDVCFLSLDISAIDSEDFPSLRNVIENFNCSHPRTYYANSGRQLRISNTTCSKLLCCTIVRNSLLWVNFDASNLTISCQFF